MIRPSLQLSLLLLYLLLTTLQGCDRCGCGEASDHLAELVETQGEIQRDWAKKLNKWRSASIGAVFDVGDGVRAKARSEAVLKLSEGSFARLKANSMIRFLRTMPGSRSKGIDLQQGEAEIEVGSESLQLVSSIGEATLEAGSRVRLHKSNKGIRTLSPKSAEKLRLWPVNINSFVVIRCVAAGCPSKFCHSLPR